MQRFRAPSLTSLALAALAAVVAMPTAAQPALLKLDDAALRRAGVELAPVAAGTAGGGLSLGGTASLPPQASVLVSAPAAGVVQALHVGLADPVRAGQPLVSLHSPELAALQRDYLQLRLQAQQAADRLRRDEQLLADGVIAEARLRESRYAEQQARVAAEERRQALRLAGLGDAQLRTLVDRLTVQPALGLSAPAAGRVAELLAQPGQQVAAGAPLLRLARPAPLTLLLQATPAQAAQLRPGAAVQVEGCAVGGQVRGTLPDMQGASQSVLVQVALDRAVDCVQPNQAVRVRVATPAGAAGTARVPAAAVVQLDGRPQVFVAVPGGLRPQPVTVRGSDGDQALVDGLPAQARVAVRGLAALKGAWSGLGEVLPAKAASAGGR